MIQKVQCLFSQYFFSIISLILQSIAGIWFIFLKLPFSSTVDHPYELLLSNTKTSFILSHIKQIFNLQTQQI